VRGSQPEEPVHLPGSSGPIRQTPVGFRRLRHDQRLVSQSGADPTRSARQPLSLPSKAAPRRVARRRSCGHRRLRATTRPVERELDDVLPGRTGRSGPHGAPPVAEAHRGMARIRQVRFHPGRHVRTARPFGFLLAETRRLSSRGEPSRVLRAHGVEIHSAQGRSLFALGQDDRGRIGELPRRTAHCTSPLTSRVERIEALGYARTGFRPAGPGRGPDCTNEESQGWRPSSGESPRRG